MQPAATASTEDGDAAPAEAAAASAEGVGGAELTPASAAAALHAVGADPASATEEWVSFWHFLIENIIQGFWHTWQRFKLATARISPEHSGPKSYRHNLTCPQVRHHWRMVLWKCVRYEAARPALAGRLLTGAVVLDQLKLRCALPPTDAHCLENH